MSTTKNALHVLDSLGRLATNPRTDPFGIRRHWGERHWIPGSGYSPIHAGVDYSAEPDPVIFAPCAGLVYGHKVDWPVGSAVYIRPLLGEDPVDNVMVVLMHCEPTASEWREVRDGEELTTHGGHGVGAPHVHVEVDVTIDVYRALVGDGIISDRAVTAETIRGRAARKDIDADLTEARVEQQCARWGIEFLGYDVLIRSRLPAYRHSQYSRVGKGRTAIINPEKVMG